MILDNLARHLYDVYRAEVETFSDEGGHRIPDFDDLPTVDKTGWRSVATAVIVEMGSMAQNPAFSLWLMGFPTSWHDAGLSALRSYVERETPSSRKSQPSSSKPSTK